MRGNITRIVCRQGEVKGPEAFSTGWAVGVVKSVEKCHKAEDFFLASLQSSISQKRIVLLKN